MAQAEQVSWRQELEHRYSILKDDMKYGDVKVLVEDVAKEFDMSPKTVMNYYYKMKSTEPEAPTAPQSPTTGAGIVKTDEHTKPQEKGLEGSLRSPELRPKIAPYKKGEVFEVEVTEVVQFGAFVKTLDGYEYRALIHVRDIASEFVSSPKDYFGVGDKLKARVKSCVGQRIEMSTKGLKTPKTPLPPEKDRKQRGTIGEQLAVVKHEIVQPKVSNEMIEVVTFMNGVVGMVSDKARDRLQQVIDKHGLFRVTMALSKVTQTFENDLGVHFVNEIEKSVGGCL